MSSVLIDCRLVDGALSERDLATLYSKYSTGRAACHFLVDAGALAAQPYLIDRLGLAGIPAAHVHRLHAPPAGRAQSSFAAWRDRASARIAAAIAVELDARRVIVPCTDTEHAATLWDGHALPAGIEIVVAVRDATTGEWRETVARPARLPAPSGDKPLLALVSPIPPDRSGIADYALELIPELARHYRVELVTKNPTSATPALAGFPIHGIDWFDRNAGRFDRIVYQFGNSDHHDHMFALNERHPGLVVLHDAFMSGVARHMEMTGYRPGNFNERLYLDHGYAALASRWRPKGALNTVMRYPCSLGAIGPALGVIVHSQEARSIVATHYGDKLAATLFGVPHLRAVNGQPGRAEARRSLGLNDGDFLVASFGSTSQTKLNERLLAAWKQTSMANDPRCRLVFVGGNSDAYTRRLKQSAAGTNASITGRCPAELYRTYLQAADMAVQLRCLSRGETSGAALDCMAAGLPLIVNRHGSMAELPDDAVLMIEDTFEDRAFVDAMERLRNDTAERSRLSAAAIAHVAAVHDPVAAGDLYRDAIEHAHGQLRARTPVPQLLAGIMPPAPLPQIALTTAACVQLSLPRPRQKARLFFDVTAIARNDLRSGIERAVRNLLVQFLEKQPDGYRVEPVRLEDNQLILARAYTSKLLGIRRAPFPDEAVAPRPGDIYLMVDLAHRDVVAHRDLYRDLRRQGVRTAFMVHDLLPVRMPDYFPPRAQTDHSRWLDVVGEADVNIGVTRHVAEDLADWYRGRQLAKPPAIGFSHHGAELETGVGDTSPTLWERFRLRRMGRRPAFLVVGTVEPRKGHDDLLAAFEKLWATGREANLIVVGRAGFRDLDVIAQMRRHPQRGRRLFWFRNASDALLNHLY
ncbi:MAG: glycosyltransferase, partial [Mesorhizobium sp.]